MAQYRIKMNNKYSEYEALINDIDALIGELTIVKNHVLNNDLETAGQYTDGIMTASEELRDKVTEYSDEHP